MQTESTRMLKDVTITVVFDNYLFQDGLETAWGFSCFIEGANKNILFDTGSKGRVLLANMKQLGIAPQDVELLIISHNHWDHTGGMADLLEQHHDLTAYLPHSFTPDVKEIVQQSGAQLVEVTDAQEICPAVYSTGDLDAHIREQSLILRTGQGMIIITGCAHPGIVRIVRTAKEFFQDDDILLVMGGFHLKGDSAESIAGIIEEFKRLGVKYAAPSHCSGDTARQAFEQAYQSHFIRIGAGKIIDSDLFQQ